MQQTDRAGSRRLLPATPVDVDAAFIADVLAGNGLPHDVRAVGWQRIGTDRGISSMVGRVRVTYTDDDGGVPSLIVKLAPEPVTDDAGAVEVHFYRHLAPQSPLGSPRCLFADADVASGRLAIVLEDLGGLASPGDVAGLDLVHASAAVEALAAFHARFAPVADGCAWAHELDREDAAQMEGWLTRNLDETLKRTAGRLAPDQAAVCERLPGRVGEIVTQLGRPPRTLSHHDFRADNLFFRDDGSVVAVDWEGLTRLRGGFDLGMFLGTSLGKDAFTSHATTLIDAYANGVRNAGFDYEAGEIARDVRLGVLLQLVWASYVFSEPVLGTGRPLRVVATWLDRLTHAASRLDAFAALERA